MKFINREQEVSGLEKFWNEDASQLIRRNDSSGMVCPAPDVVY